MSLKTENESPKNKLKMFALNKITPLYSINHYFETTNNNKKQKTSNTFSVTLVLIGVVQFLDVVIFVVIFVVVSIVIVLLNVPEDDGSDETVLEVGWKLLDDFIISVDVCWFVDDNKVA